MIVERREFIKRLLYSGAVIGTPALGLRPVPARADHGVGASPRTLVNVMLRGGLDFRYLFVPAPGSTYADAFWTAREPLYEVDPATTTYEQIWEEQYLPAEFDLGGPVLTFGIHKSAAWLHGQFEQGNAAIVCNVYASTNRGHEHSQLMVETGDPDADRSNLRRDGWGGRLAYAVSDVEGSTANVVPVGQAVPIFANGVNGDDRLERVVHGQNLREMGLPGPDAASPGSARSVLSRALRAYYVGRGDEIDLEKPASWPYRRFFSHERSIRGAAASVISRLESHPRPEALVGLYSGFNRLRNSDFGAQCANYYDCILAQDLLNMRVSSMDYGNWDTHSREKEILEGNLEEVFGANGGLAVLDQELEALGEGKDSTVFVATTDFGRQIQANGDRGTDHGVGGYSIVVGPAVGGGVYGEMFPDREVQPDPDDADGRTPYEIPGSDIDGLTALERVLGEVCEWVSPGAGDIVFADRGLSDLEEDVDLSTLMQAGV